jgi:hypothetical protein
LEQVALLFDGKDAKVSSFNAVADEMLNSKDGELEVEKVAEPKATH